MVDTYIANEVTNDVRDIFGRYIMPITCKHGDIVGLLMIEKINGR